MNKTNRFNFTQDRIEKLKPAQNKRDTFYDTQQQRLAIRVTGTGTKTFYVIKKGADSKTKWISLGKCTETSVYKARQDAISILDDIRKGLDPNTLKRNHKLHSINLIEVFDHYIKNRGLKERTLSDYKEKIDTGFSDWLKKPASEITNEMVISRHRNLTESRGKTTTNNCMRVLRLLLRYAKAIGVVEHIATEVLNSARLWHKPKRKDRIIPSEKLNEWYQEVLKLENTKARVYLLLLLHTGIRSSETGVVDRSEKYELLWSSVNLGDKEFVLLNPKNKTPITLPVPDVLIPHLLQLQLLTGRSKWLFPNKDNTSPMSIPQKPINKIREGCAIEFSPHDLRRTFATIAEAVYLPQTIIKRLLNHVTDNDVTGGYIRTEMETLREATNRISGYIISKVSDENKVIPFINSRQ
jgi:integrase